MDFVRTFPTRSFLMSLPWRRHRVELMNHMRHMQQAHDGMMQRLLMTLQELERIEVRDRET